jgi:uncharacterized repeat protein (TIGR01451 family)
VWNEGEGALFGDVDVSDTLESPLMFAPEPDQSADVQTWCDFIRQEVTCTIPKAEVGTTEEPAATFQVLVYALASAGKGTYDNVVIVSTPGDEECLPGDECEPPPPCVPGADVALSNVACDDTTVLRGSIEVVKMDATDGATLAGAVFQLWLDANDNGKGDAGEEIGLPQTTGDDGIATWDDLAWGKYLVQETKAPTGYALSDPAIRSVVINSDTFATSVEPVTFAVEAVNVAGNYATVTGHEPFSPEANKVSYWCKEGPGIKFDDEVSGKMTYALTQDYDLVVVKAGSGDTANTLFANPTAGQIVWADFNPGDPEFGPGEGDKEISHIILCGTADEPGDGEVSLIFANPRLPGSIEVIKKDDAGAPLAGVTFELFADANGNGKVEPKESLGQKTTTATGSLTWGSLEWRDDYKVLEVSWPTNYAPGDDLVTGPYTINQDVLSVTVNRVNYRLAITADVTSFCIKDAPYYSLKVTPLNGKYFSSQEATVRWYQANAQGQPIDAQGNPTTDPAKYVPAYDPAKGPGKGDYVDTYTLKDGALNLENVLWKGAAVDANGSATAWPGWTQPSPGVWVQVNSGGVRPGMFAVVSVNPTATTAAVYPPAASPCANPPGVPKLDKFADPTEGTEVAIGETIDYSVKVTNTGGSTFTGQMVDTLPAGFTVTGAISDGGVLTGNTITWQVTLEAQASKTFTYSGTVDDTAFGDLINTVVLTTPAGPISDSTVHPVAVVEAIEDEVVASEEEELADTGAGNIGDFVGAALLAMLAGGLMVTFGRRRRNQG